MDRNRISGITIRLALLVALLAPRIPQIGSFVTLDEPAWLSQGANFYYALGQREFEKTVYEYQPAVTTMWIVAAAMHLYFPDYRGLGQGYLDYEKGSLDPFMEKHGYDPRVLFELSRLIQVFIVTALFLLLYDLLQRLLPRLAAACAVLFASFDPFSLGHSRMLDHEAMVSLFVLISLLSLVVYFAKDRRLVFLLLSGIAAGLAQLTKSSAIAMFAAVGILFLMQVVHERERGIGRALLGHLKDFFIWSVALVVVYFLVWPGMWVAPGKMLYEVYGNAFSYAFQGSRLKITEELDVASFTVDTNWGGILEVARVLVYRITPLAWLGILFGFFLPFPRDRGQVHLHRQLFTLLLVTAIAFVLMIGIAQGRNSPHYILSSYLAVNVLAGLGWFAFIQWFGGRFSWVHWQYGALSVLWMVQASSALSYFPYYFTYRNPVLHSLGWHMEFPQFPYGEGLELAARHLAEMPNAADQTVFTYYSRGCFSYFYPGTSLGFRPYYVDGNHAEDLLGNLRASDYLIVYYANQGQLPHYRGYLEILSAVQPFHVIWVDGYEYIRIYKVDELPPEIFEALSNL